LSFRATKDAAILDDFALKLHQQTPEKMLVLLTGELLKVAQQTNKIK
jgi:hypothetical protein